MEFRPKQLVDKKIAAVLDISDLDIQEKENIKDLLEFNVSAYDKLNKLKKEDRLRGCNYEVWNDTFAAINHFLSLLDYNSKCEIVYALTLMHADILDFFTKAETNDLTVLTKVLSERCDALDLSTNLCDKLKAYALEHIPIGLMPNAGKRPQDNAKLTFYPDEVATLMSITLLCKLLSPIFGVLMNNLIGNMNIKAKELCCATIFTKLFNRKFEQLIDKLKYYIRHTVNVQCKKDTTMALMHGCDNYSLSHVLYSLLLIRQFVNVPLIRKNGNLITYIVVNVKKAITTVQSAMLRKPTYSRPLFSSDSDDDGNTSRLETDSVTSNRTCDVNMLVKCAVPYTIKKYIALYDLDEDDYNKCLEFYKREPMMPTLLNKDMNSMFYSRDFGGGKGILMLKALDYAKITALLQLILFQLSADDGYRQLAHMLTILPSVDVKEGFTFEDNQFKLNIGSSIGYRNCRQRFENSPFGQKGKEWDDHITNITNDLIIRKYRYNTANWIWQWLGEDNLNGRLVTPDDRIIAALCDFYDWLHGIQQ